MDPSLTKQVTDFRKKSFANSIRGVAKTSFLKKRDTSKRPLPSQLVSKKDSKKRSKIQQKQPAESGLKLKKARSKFSLLATIVEFLKTNFMNNNLGPFTLDHVLAATDNSEAAYLERVWLLQNALTNNPRVRLNGEQLSYKPIFELTDKRSLFRLIQQYDENGLGGINFDDIRESVANSEHLIRSLRNHICHVTRKDNEKDVIFFYDPTHQINVCHDFIKSWKQFSFESLEDKDIEAELKKEGANMPRLLLSSGKRQKPSSNINKHKGKRPTKISNVHLSSDILKDFLD